MGTLGRVDIFCDDRGHLIDRHVFVLCGCNCGCIAKGEFTRHVFHTENQALMVPQTERLERNVHHQLRCSHIWNGIGSFKIDRVRCSRLIKEDRVIFSRLEPAIIGVHLVDLKGGPVHLLEQIHQSVSAKSCQIRRLLKPDAELSLIRTDHLTRVQRRGWSPRDWNGRRDKLANHPFIGNQPNRVGVIDFIDFQQSMEAHALTIPGKHIRCHLAQPRRPFTNTGGVIFGGRLS